MMMRLGKLFTAAAAVGLMATSVQAAITVSWSPLTISPAAITADPTLANHQSWSLRVVTDGNWASAGMEATLPAGSVFYNPALGGNTRPNAAIVTAFPNIGYDTFVSAPADTGSGGAPAILGFFPEAPGTGDFGGTTGRFSVSWGDLVEDAPGDYEIARLTFPSGVIPTIRTVPPAPNSPSITSQVNPASDAFIPAIPEPTTLGLVAAAGLMAIRRRRA
jgi:hypothetical protein